MTQAAAAREVVRLYRLRWRIKEVFRALKCDGLGLDATQVRCPTSCSGWPPWPWMKLPANLGQTVGTALGRIVPVKMPAFAGAGPIPHSADEAEILRELEARVKKPIVAGMAVVVVFVLGTFVWSAVASLHGAITTPGYLRGESSRKTIKHRDGGVVREILVKEGAVVKQGDVLIRMDDAMPRSMVEVMSAGLDGLLVQRARLYAERDDAASITLPKEIVARAADPDSAPASARSSTTSPAPCAIRSGGR